jgi:hypothetical protein
MAVSVVRPGHVYPSAGSFFDRRKMPAPEGRHWNTDTIRRILGNPIYVGDHAWNRRHSGKYAGVLHGEIVRESVLVEQYGPRKHRCVPNPREEWVVVKNAHPALVTRELFDRVQAKLDSHRGRVRGTIVDPLKGLVACGHCGCIMNINHHRYVRKDKEVYYRRLECPSYHTKGPTACRPRSICQPILQQLVITLLREQVLDAELETRTRVKAQTEPNLCESMVADVMALAARYRVALASGKVDLLCGAIGGLIERIELWFGRHPTIRLASRASEGRIHLRTPFTSVNGTVELRFGRDEFDRAAKMIPARMRHVAWSKANQ